MLLLVTLVLSLAPRECNLTGQGEVDYCESIYLRTRGISLIAPSYIVSTDGAHVHHGLSWTLAIDVPKDEWSDYFEFGKPPEDTHGFPFHLGVAASFVWFPGNSVEGRLVLRARIMSLVWPDNPALSFLHLTVAAGASGGTFGAAPRIELRARVGHIAWGGLAIAIGFQPQVLQSRYVGDFSIGLDAPWVWWW
jgi:hypothetical protein